MKQFKTKALKQLSSNSSNKTSFFNSSIPISIVVGIVNTNGTQVSGYGNISSSVNKKVDGNTVFDIASIEKTFVTTILADMVKQGLVNLDDPVEKYLPSNNVTVPVYKGHKITLKDLATHTSGLPDFPARQWLWLRRHRGAPLWTGRRVPRRDMARGSRHPDGSRARTVRGCDQSGPTLPTQPGRDPANS